ncbi:zinc-binding dehydrogenase [Halobium salinum]|uniref:Zinc-binding dehydrogenase n=1 Tax=Halobium salinum TaxID=1364940 RepID=A0ABD5PD47_9EURY|nr:zinc-binding dehydrogenase [Halobium salinum]
MRRRSQPTRVDRTTGRSLYFVGPRAARVEDRAVPDPGPDEVLVETRASLVSAGTELLVYRGNAPTDLPADETIDALAGDLSFPLRYGYAAVGEVAAVGEAVETEWAGRRVFAFNPHETRFVADPASLHPLPEGVGVEAATFLPNVETAVNLVHDANPRLGERVVVLGAGVVGLLTTALLARFPLSRLTVVDPLESRRGRARAVGADETVSPADARETLDGDADAVLELSGSPATLDDAVTHVGYDGRVVVGSWYGRKRAPVDLGGRFHRSRVSLVSSQVSTIDPALRGRWTKERRLGVAWDRLCDLDPAGLVTHRIPFEEAPRAYDLLDDGATDALGVLFTYD